MAKIYLLEWELTAYSLLVVISFLLWKKLAYIKLFFTLISSYFWSIKGQTHGWHHLILVFVCCIKQMDSLLLSVTHLPKCLCETFFNLFSTTFWCRLWSVTKHYWTDARQRGIYLLNIWWTETNRKWPILAVIVCSKSEHSSIKQT